LKHQLHEGRNAMNDVFDMIAAPAKRALVSIGIQDTKDICGHTRYEIEMLHGIGKNALLQIDRLLASLKLDYQDEADSQEIDMYIEGCEELVKEKLYEIRKLIRGTIPKAKEKMAYGMPTYYYHENIVHFAAFKNHIGLYPTPNGVEGFETELRGYTWSKGAIQFPVKDAVPLDLIRRITGYRMEEVKRSIIKSGEAL
jgi:uncharacterized protein YdhG (YjbR/CyaY superfamily)